MMASKNTRLTITLLEDDKARLETLARQQERSESFLARQAVVKMLNMQDKRK